MERKGKERKGKERNGKERNGTEKGGKKRKRGNIAGEERCIRRDMSVYWWSNERRRSKGIKRGVKGPVEEKTWKRRQKGRRR